MREELDIKLQERFPWLKRPELKKDKPYEFAQGYTIYENYGFSEVSDGWYDLILSLCEEIEAIYKSEGKEVDMVLQQVKSKFAHLCWYYSLPGKPQSIHAIDSIDGSGIRLYPKGEDDNLAQRIAECVKKYEIFSRSTCELCGSTDGAQIRKDLRWKETLCQVCYLAKLEKIREGKEKRKLKDAPKKEDFLDNEE